MPFAIWYFTKSFRLPTAAMLDRLSIACSTSGGTETFSTMKLAICRPYFARTTGLMSGSSASPSSRVARRDVEHRHLRRRQRVAEDADDARAHRVGELVEPEVLVRAGHFLQEQLRVDDLEVVGAERARADDPEVLVAHHDRVARCPTCCP